MPGTIVTGSLGSGHPTTRIGDGARVVLAIPGLMFTASPPSERTARTIWKGWDAAASASDLTIHDVGRRGDLPPGATVMDIADDYAAVIRREFTPPVGVMGVSTGGAYAMWLAIRHPDLVSRLLLGFTAHRLPPSTARAQRRFTALALDGRWRRAYALAGPLFMPRLGGLASALFWLVGPYAMGSPRHPTVLPIDTEAEARHDATDALQAIRCPTLVVSGGRDPFYPPTLMRELAGLIPGAVHVEYASVGHTGGGPRFAQDATAFFAGE